MSIFSTKKSSASQDFMKSGLTLGSATLVLVTLLLTGCASAIVDSEGMATAGAVLTPKPQEHPIAVYFTDKAPERKVEEVGRVSARAWVLEKGLTALKDEARKLGADAITNVKYERRFSADYLQDLYFLDGNAVILK